MRLRRLDALRDRTWLSAMVGVGLVVALWGCGGGGSDSPLDASLEDSAGDQTARADGAPDGPSADQADLGVPDAAVDADAHADTLVDVSPEDLTDLSDLVELVDLGDSTDLADSQPLEDALSDGETTDSSTDVHVCEPGVAVCEGEEVRICLPDGSGLGDVVETCDGVAGEVCVGGMCKTACQMAFEKPSSAGCEFWAVDLDQQDSMNDPASATWGVLISNPGQTVATVIVEINQAPLGEALNLSQVDQLLVQPGDLVTIPMPTRELDCGTAPNDYASPGTCLSSQAIRLTSTIPVVAYQFNVLENAYSNDASLLLPTSALGTQYRILGWGAGHPIPLDFPGMPRIVDRAYVTIVGTQPVTTVLVRPSWRIKGNPPIAATAAGGEIQVVLGPFDVLNLETDDATQDDPVLSVADLSGTSVVASAPVAVFSGVESAGVPGAFDIPTYPSWTEGDSCCLDHLEEQVVPANSIGSHYVVARSPVRSTGGFREPDIIRFVGLAEEATVATTLPAPFNLFTLSPGEVRTTWAQDNFVVDATHPIVVGQLLVSSQYTEGPGLGDPSLVMMPSVEQFLTEYQILTPGGWTQSWIAVSTPIGADLVIDGLPAANCISEPAGTLLGVAYVSLRCPLTEGVHKVSSALPIGVVAYGYGDNGSYALVGGVNAIYFYDAPPMQIPTL